ncbi:allophanate hydrolase subunit 1 [Pseudomonas sp. MAFF 730085]|uniref:Allophanate hydrolase subunit 1 n=1 Tax=Pseudomonas kitaguniensis TaxID=2607908 RepID=A0A5N7JP45_9PSED|nr:allophanate hydrolase subunit 1 [Pseudomonas kitaguniensis]MPQ83170.1 allophanate hydrolase subunit 1 [Pseudomonas kitaguniensis]
MSDLSRILDEPPRASFSSVKWHFEPCGDRCVILIFGSVFSIELNRQAASVGSQLRTLAAQGQLPGVTDVVSAMVTVGVHYSPESIASLYPGVSPYESVCTRVTERLKDSHNTGATIGARLDIPVCYDPEFAPDLEDIAQACGLSANEVIAAHTGDWLDVLMVGFAPGHPYIGMHDSALSLPRRATPRTLVKQGSIGIANRQSVIYPADLPGGWNLIGRTPLPMFSPLSEPPCVLQGGDQIRFVPITRHEFDLLAREHAK